MDNRTQMLTADPNRTILGAPPMAGEGMDPNRTIIGSVSRENLTVSIAPQRCPVCKSFNQAGVIYCNECGLIFGTISEGEAFSAPAVQLPKLMESGGKEHALRAGETTIGREGDISLADNRVSRKHARITNQGGTVTIEDLGSTNGTRRNGVPLAAGERAVLGSGDTVSFGGLELRYSTPDAPAGTGGNTTQTFGGNKTAAISAPPSAKPFARLVGGEYDLALKPGLNTFGRKAGNDVVIPDPYVSGKHGQIEIDETEVYVTDTGSTNGTVIAGAKIPAGERIRLAPGETIKLGAIELKVERRDPVA